MNYLTNDKITVFGMSHPIAKILVWLLIIFLTGGIGLLFLLMHIYSTRKK